ncbi:unnamed protein product [Periconia digitata]|uniref:Uncharacterized protein n=1 Tax=Periconia digitata TaxID=1303443 RepID=A0A9W4U212_9PLEO|nr:unnamed protein product [Periconia digitata]
MRSNSCKRTYETIEQVLPADDMIGVYKVVYMKIRYPYMLSKILDGNLRQHCPIVSILLLPLLSNSIVLCAVFRTRSPFKASVNMHCAVHESRGEADSLCASEIV